MRFRHARTIRLAWPILTAFWAETGHLLYLHNHRLPDYWLLQKQTKL
jgi:hypothetical protein